MEILRAEVAILVVAALLEGAGVEDADDLAGEGVGDVGDELEGVIEGADDEAVVTTGRQNVSLEVSNFSHFSIFGSQIDRWMGLVIVSLQSKRTFDEIEADTARVDDDQSRDIGTGRVDHGRCQSGL